jgi:hypothetical protein
MQPKTIFQKHVAGLQKKLKPVAEKKIQWGYDHCFEPQGVLTNKRSGCLECGHTWEQDGKKLMAVIACSCPNCGKELKMERTRSRKHSDSAYYAVITTLKGFQVVRMLYLTKYCKLGIAARLHKSEVMQHWIDAKGGSCVFAKLTNPFGNYYDAWIGNSALELRGSNSNMHTAKNLIVPYKIHPAMRIIPEVKRNGFAGDFLNLAPAPFFTRLLSDSKIETLLKTGQKALLQHYFNRYNYGFGEHWDSVKICIRNGYIVKDAGLWNDYLQLLRHFNKDLRNPKFICPDNLRSEHNKLVRKRNAIFERQDAEKKAQDLALSQAEYKKSKGKFFGVCFSDQDLTVKVLESTEEFKKEGEALAHCVFASKYFQKPDSLLMSARIGDEPIETIELSLSGMKVIQCRGYNNKPTEHNSRIISLVNNNLNIIRKIYETTEERAVLQSM